ncbi:hypothetical protein Pnap_4931 (plasmid) [Polaromonas naphthalenivorans CJ2]|uniref:Uncharacterized protein n=1 Tax=Polaromonas naphthalenivorans (strain CJ2) TaxID=365044 RepID=A1VWG6_POLNA|nr:hypothetical protein Pnap_4931 [Polaromonas naphthalenivorans CJ2]
MHKTPAPTGELMCWNGLYFFSRHAKKQQISQRAQLSRRVKTQRVTMPVLRNASTVVPLIVGSTGLKLLGKGSWKGRQARLRWCKKCSFACTPKRGRCTPPCVRRADGAQGKVMMHACSRSCRCTFRRK